MYYIFNPKKWSGLENCRNAFLAYTFSSEKIFFHGISPPSPVLNPCSRVGFSFFFSQAQSCGIFWLQRKCYSKPSLFIVELSSFLLEYNERLDFEETAMKECLLNTRENPVTIQPQS